MSSGTSRFELLGVSIRLRADEDELRQRLEICYGASLTSPGAPAKIEAEVRRDGDWRVEVEGREGRSLPDFEQAVRALNHELMHAVMRCRRDLFYVHAGVVGWRRQALVFPGLSRAGKSTLVLAALHAGAQLLSDELLAYDPVAGRAVAFPRALKIRDECVDYFPRWRDAFVGTGEARFLPFGSLDADVVSEPALVAAVVSPTWSAEGPNRLTPAGLGRAFLDLTASALNFGTHREASLDPLTAILQRAQAFELSWKEPHGAVERIFEAVGWRP